MGVERPQYFLDKLRHYDWWYSQRGREYLTRLYRDSGDVAAKPFYRKVIMTQDRSGQRDLARLTRLYTQGLKSAQAGTLFGTRQARSGAADWYPVSGFAKQWRAAIARDLEAEQPQRAVYSYVAEKLRAMPRYTLLPPPA